MVLDFNGSVYVCSYVSKLVGIITDSNTRFESHFQMLRHLSPPLSQFNFWQWDGTVWYGSVIAQNSVETNAMTGAG